MQKVLLDIGTGEIILAIIFLLLIVFGPISGIIQVVKQHKNKLN